MNTLYKKKEDDFELLAVRKISSIFDLDLRLQCHISDLKPSLSSTHHKQSLGVIWSEQFVDRFVVYLTFDAILYNPQAIIVPKLNNLHQKV